MKKPRSAQKIADAVNCYRLKTEEDRIFCKNKTCPYNNNDPENGYFCCSNMLLYDAAQKLRYQDEKIKRLERKLFDRTGRM